MTKRFFGNWITAYMEHTQHQESPDQFHFWTAVSTIAGALRRQVWFQMGYFEWTPNLYIIFVAKPGVVAKSTSIDLGMSILRKLQHIKFGPNAITWQALITKLAESTELVDMGGGTFEPMSAITIAASELGTLINPRDREMIDALTDLWDSKRGVWSKVTKMNGCDDIENPWINIIACTTPHWIADNVPESMIGGGFASRCVFVYGAEKRCIISYPADHIPKDFEETKFKLAHDLEIISQIKGPFKITDEAKAWGDAWNVKMQKETPPHLQTERAGAYLVRKQTLLHKLAMIISAATKDETCITIQDLKIADFYLTLTEKDREIVFARVGRSHEASIVDNIISYVYRHGNSVSEQTLMRDMINTVDYETYKKARDAACLSGYLKAVQRGPGLFIEAGAHRKDF